MHIGTSDQAMNYKHVRTSDGTLDESVRSRHSNSSPGVIIDRSGNSMHSEGANPNMILESDRNYYFDTLINGSRNKLTSVKSSSSVSSESSSDDLFQVDPVFTKSESSTASYFNDMRSKSKDELDDLSSQSSANSKSDNGSPGPRSTSQDYGEIPHLIDMLPTSIPPAQVMDRSTGYDPFRIPSSVFATNKSNNPMDWSMASNDSLFSIQLGNDSFTRDHLYMLGELAKAGELTKSGELLLFSSHPPVIAEEVSQKIEVADEDFKSEHRASEDQKEAKESNPAISCLQPNVSCVSRASEQSFAFPILTQAGSVNSTKTDVRQQLAEKEAPKVTSNSTANSYCWQCFSWSCCSWGNCCQFRCHCPCCNCRCGHYHFC